MFSFRRFVLVALIAACGVGCTASPASAARGFGLSFSFNSPEGFANALSAGVDQSNGDVYIGEFGDESHPDVLWKFKPNLEAKSAEPEESFGTAGHVQIPHLFKPQAGLPFQSAVDAAGHVYVPDLINGTVTKFTSAGVELPPGEPLLTGLGQPTGVGVDAAGAIFVAELGGNVREFNAAGEPIDAAGAKNPENVVANAGSQVKAFAVDASGEHIYLASEGSGALQYTLSAGAFAKTATLGSGEADGVAVAPSTPASSSAGMVFVESGGQISEFEPSGTLLRKFGSGSGLAGDAARLAVYGTASGTVIFAPNHGAVDVFTEGETPETPLTEPATEITGTTAELHGKLNPAGKAGPLEYNFTYGTAGKCEGGETPTEEVGEAKEAPVSRQATNLAPETEYTYCLVAKSPFGSTPGSPQTFKTGAGPPKVTVTGVVETTSAAKLQATINAQGAATKCVVEYGLTTSYGNEAKCVPEELAAGVEDTPVTAELGGLEPSTTYHFRFKATNEKGEGAPGEGEGEFTTKPLATAETAAPTNIQAEAATFNGTVNLATSDPTNYYFEYEVEEGGVFVKTPPVAISGEGPHGVSATVTGLTPDLAYHVRLVGEVVGHLPLAEGSLQPFKTGFLVPVATVQAAQSVTATTALLSGEVNPNKSETWYSFELEYSSEGQTHVSNTSLQELPFAGEPGTTPVAAGPAVLRELRPATVYRYRIIATNTGGTGASTYGEFTTLPAQPPAIEAVSGQATSPTTATVSATVNPNGLPTSYTLELGPDTSYGTQLSGHLPEDGQLSFALTGLLPGSIYHFRLLATNPEGTVAAPDTILSTPGFPQALAPPPPVTIFAFTAPPVEHSTSPSTKPRSRAQLLTKALKACNKKPKRKHATCVKRAKKRYGPTTKKKKKKK